MTLQQRIDAKQAQIDDALGWVQDLKDLRAAGHELSHADIFNATNYVTILQDDMRRLRAELT